MSMHSVRELGIFEAEEIGGFLLRGFKSLTVTVGLEDKESQSSQAEVFRVSEVKEIWSLCKWYLRVPQADGTGVTSRYLRSRSTRVFR